MMSLSLSDTRLLAGLPAAQAAPCWAALLRMVRLLASTWRRLGGLCSLAPWLGLGLLAGLLTALAWPEAPF